jgi:hypothetical protein
MKRLERSKPQNEDLVTQLLQEGLYRSWFNISIWKILSSKQYEFLEYILNWKKTKLSQIEKIKPMIKESILNDNLNIKSQLWHPDLGLFYVKNLDKMLLTLIKFNFVLSRSI